MDHDDNDTGNDDNGNGGEGFNDAADGDDRNNHDIHPSYQPAGQGHLKRKRQTGYIESLENRLKEMEALLRPAAAASASDTAASASASAAAAAPGGSARNATNSNAAYYGAGADGTADAGNSGAGGGGAMHDGVPPEATAELLELFFHFLHPVMPLIHKPTFYANFATHSPLLLNAMYALAARFSSHPKIATENSRYNAGDLFYVKAREMVDHYMDVPTASTVTALLILANYAAESDRGSAAWMYSGMAIRMAQELKLNVEPDFEEDSFAQSSNLTWLDKEARRRLWWNCFILDRYAGAAADRSMIINEKDCKVYLPSLESHWESATGPSEMAAASGGGLNDTYQIAVLTSTNVFTPGLSSQSPYGYFVLLIKIFGKILEYSNLLKTTQRTNVSPPALTPDADYQLTVLDASLRDWFSSLPEWVHDFGLDGGGKIGTPAPDGTSPWQTAYLHIFYHVCVIMLHRPRMSASVRGNSGGAGGDTTAISGVAVLQNPSFIVCLSSANAVAKVLTLVAQTNPNFLYFSPFLGFCIFQSGLVHLLASQLGGRAAAAQRRQTAAATTTTTTSSEAANGGWTDPQLANVITQAEYNVAGHLAALAGVSRFWFMPSRLHAMLRGLAEGARAGENGIGGGGSAATGARAILGSSSAANHGGDQQPWVMEQDRYPPEQLLHLQQLQQQQQQQQYAAVIVPGLASSSSPDPAIGVPPPSSSSSSASSLPYRQAQQTQPPPLSAASPTPPSSSSTGMMAAAAQQHLMQTEGQLQGRPAANAAAAQIQSAINMSTALFGGGQQQQHQQPPLSYDAHLLQQYMQQQQHQQQQQQQQLQMEAMGSMGAPPGLYPAEYTYLTLQQQSLYQQQQRQQQQSWPASGPAQHNLRQNSDPQLQQQQRIAAAMLAHQQQQRRFGT
ncbi:hypothetical protein HDU86_002464 [Geranomyces michiganensis]|nr:hypothetical protein HDU86_002464 [Geranomyces michiganensis]